jgi:phosphoribosylformylglycinamidine synthase
MKVGVLVFPGTWSHQDFAHVLQDVLGCDWGYVWHKDTSAAGYDCLILPGGRPRHSSAAPSAPSRPS